MEFLIYPEYAYWWLGCEENENGLYIYLFLFGWINMAINIWASIEEQQIAAACFIYD